MNSEAESFSDFLNRVAKQIYEDSSPCCRRVWVMSPKEFEWFEEQGIYFDGGEKDAK